MAVYQTQMTRCSISMPEDCWSYADLEAIRMKISRSSAISYLIREARESRLLERLDSLEKEVEQLRLMAHVHPVEYGA